jgi:hypothetical protein
LVLGGIVISFAFLIGGTILRPLMPLWLRLGLLAPFLVFIVLREHGMFPNIRMPENRRLVPETVFRYGDTLGPMQFGFEMGTASRTYLPSGLPYVTALCVAFLASPWLALVAGIGFGIGRSVMTVSSVTYDPDGGWDLEWSAYQKFLVPYTASLFVLITCVIAWQLPWH